MQTPGVILETLQAFLLLNAYLSREKNGLISAVNAENCMSLPFKQ